MSPRGKHYTLVGFSSELDWRPLHFVKPIPEYRVCGACGLVRTRTALLPCTHTLCESCYGQCSQDGARVCPLDGRQCEEEDVFLKQFPADELLRRQVKCWNEGKECGALVAASEIAQHFQSECGYHSICCPKCSARVLCSDVCAHLRSEFCSTDTRAASAGERQARYRDEAVLPETFRESLEWQASEIKALLERLLFDADVNASRLNEVIHGVNDCKEGLREELWQAISSLPGTGRQEVESAETDQCDSGEKCFLEILAFRKETEQNLTAIRYTQQIISNNLQGLKQIQEGVLAKAARENLGKVTEIAGAMKDANEQLRESKEAVNHIEELLKHAGRQASMYEFVITDVKSLRKETLECGQCRCDAGRVYLRSYCISPGVYLINYGNTVTMHAWLQLHKGEKDDILEWPFKQTIKLRVQHPNGRAELQLKRRTTGTHPAFQKPEPSGSNPSWRSTISLNLDDLMNEGFLEDDKLRVKFAVLP